MYGKGKSYLYGALISYFLGLLSKEKHDYFAAVIPLTLWVLVALIAIKHGNGLACWPFVSFVYLMMRFSISGVPQLNQKITDIMNNPLP